MHAGDPRFAGALAEALLARDVPGATAAERRAAARFVAERLSGAPAFTRLGMAAVGLVLAVPVRLFERTPFATLAPARQAVWVARWSARPLPGIAEYLDAVRGLALTRHYEEHTA
jgi:hypothetical protein